jgi:hypothetical protein
MRSKTMTTRTRKTPAWLSLLALATLAAPPLEAQFIPYYGKARVKYDNFSWRVYRSPHFEAYYYPEFEQHLERLVSYLESAYQHVSSELKHEIPFAIPVIFYKTHSEFAQTSLFPIDVPEGVLAFAEPVRDRMLLPIDEPPDKLQGLITHELTHIFEFDLIPRSLIQRGVPLWVDEGLADYMRASWDILDLMMVRDAAIADQLPRMSRSSDLSRFGNVRLTYNLGHAAFEYIEARFGKEGTRQFLYTLRKNVLGGSVDDIYQQAFRMSADEFDKGFEKWLKERFKPYRDKQRPDDYGPALSPDPERGPYIGVYGFAPSPSGELVAAFTGNRADGELDVVLLSAKDGKVIKNLTAGYTGKYEDINFSDEFVAGRNLDFSPTGDAVAFFARDGKNRSLFLVSPLSGEILRKVPVDLDQAQSPALLPDGRRAVIAGRREGVSDIYLLDLDSGETTNLTRDAFADSNPRVSPDGRYVAYNRRISGSEKIYIFPLDAPDQKTQLTFGVHDDLAPSFSADGQLVYYSASEDDDIYNVRSLDLRTGVIRQYTDVLGGNMAPAVLRREGGEKVAFISYYKGDYLLAALDTNEPLREVDQEVRLASEEILDFQPDVAHQVVPENKRRKKLFEGLYLEGRPPLNLGITSSGDFFGGSQVALTDVLGDHAFLFTIASFREFRSYDGTYTNRTGRLNWGASVFDNTRFFFPAFLIPQYSSDFRAGVIATQRVTGGAFFAQYPLDKYRRLTFSAGVYRLRERYENPLVEEEFRRQAEAAGVPFYLNNGTLAPLQLALTQETTRFQEFGPLTGSTFNLSALWAPALGGNLARTTLNGDARAYLRLGSTSTLLAFRVRGFKSFGDNPDIFYFGGNMELRGYPYYSISGNEGFFANAEFRFPIINVALTPIGLIGPIRGTAYFGIGGAKYKGQNYQFSSSEPGTSFINYNPEDPSTWFGEPVDGFHLVDGAASFGFGLQVFFLGYPLHFDWTKFTDFAVTSKNSRFDFWLGFDF